MKISCKCRYFQISKWLSGTLNRILDLNFLMIIKSNPFSPLLVYWKLLNYVIFHLTERCWSPRQTCEGVQLSYLEWKDRLLKRATFPFFTWRLYQVGLKIIINTWYLLKSSHMYTTHKKHFNYITYSVFFKHQTRGRESEGDVWEARMCWCVHVTPYRRTACFPFNIKKKT